MVSTDTLNRGGYMGGRCVALTWSSEIDGRPDWLLKQFTGFRGLFDWQAGVRRFALFIYGLRP